VPLYPYNSKLTISLLRFHRTSAWDNDVSQGTQTVNAIVLVEIVDPTDNNVKLDATSENYRWIPLNADSAKANGEDNYVVQALLRLNAWNPNYMWSWECMGWKLPNPMQRRRYLIAAD
jgi:hypothetical protein